MVIMQHSSVEKSIYPIVVQSAAGILLIDISVALESSYPRQVIVSTCLLQDSHRLVDERAKRTDDGAVLLLSPSHANLRDRKSVV